MTELTPITALGATAAATVTHGALTLTERPDIALASVALRRGVAPPASLPDVGRIAEGAFWIGPDQWMLQGPGQGNADFARQVARDFPDCSVTEQTDGFCVVEVMSTRGSIAIEALIAKLANLDPIALGAGHAVRTVVHHMTVFLVRESEDRLTVIGMRSYARALWHALDQAALRRATYEMSAED